MLRRIASTQCGNSRKPAGAPIYLRSMMYRSFQRNEEMYEKLKKTMVAGIAEYGLLDPDIRNAFSCIRHNKQPSALRSRKQRTERRRGAAAVG